MELWQLAQSAETNRQTSPRACNTKMQAIQGVVVCDWLNVIAKFEARTTAPSILKSIFRNGDYTLQLHHPLAHVVISSNLLCRDVPKT